MSLEQSKYYSDRGLVQVDFDLITSIFHEGSKDIFLKRMLFILFGRGVLSMGPGEWGKQQSTE